MSDGLITNPQTLMEEMVARMQQQLMPQSRYTEDELKERMLQHSFPNMVEATSSIILDPWQRHMCERLQKLTYQKGQRILLHKPPQHGGSVILSQRFPAYMLGQNPTLRVKLSTYNITHSSSFSKIVKEVMAMDSYKAMFQSPDVRIPTRSKDDEWSTMGRLRLHDSQPSYKALGLETGFVGQGADLLIIDDPYPSPQAARSPAIRENVWTFWDASAKVRLNDDTNVIVMFHRYVEDDLAGRLMREEPGVWELLQYAAVYEGPWDMTDSGYRVSNAPNNIYTDPVNRKVGEKLSHRMSDTFYQEQMKKPMIWLGQFQGRPTSAEGGMFKVDRIKKFAKPPCKIIRRVRAWDLGATQDGGTYTVGVLLGLDEEENVGILDVVRGQWDSDERDRTILKTARKDGVFVRIRLPQDPGQAGKSQVKQLLKKLKGFHATAKQVSGNKETRADSFSTYVNGGLVWMLIREWNADFIEEYRVFNNGMYNDQVDAGADAFNELVVDNLSELEQFDMLSGEDIGDDEQDVLMRALIEGDYDGDIDESEPDIDEFGRGDRFGSRGYRRDGV